ncbi:MAG: glycosyltransferase family 2 protein [Candidatus Kerfeldbacteria bacterium]|nr:glycosyltransferase family 2 protein [Candidatus Kerfeldbacteria bacterium]
MKKLIVTIPAFNEEENIAEVIREIPRTIPGIDCVEVLVFDDGSTDRTCELARAAGAEHIRTHARNKGLAITFKESLWEALQLGADIIVNTDGDNHYDQSRIPELVAPILAGAADITIGSRKVAELEHMPFLNKHLNRIGSYVLTKWVGMPRMDVSTGYRGYSRTAAIQLGVYSLHTYVHTTLLSAQDLHLNILEVPIKARKVTRRSRLIKSIPSHLWKASVNIVRNVVLFRPLRFFGICSVVLFGVGAAAISRFLYFYFIDGGRGHVQSLILAGVLIILSFNSLMLGFLGSSMGWSRKISEEILFFIKKRELEQYTHDKVDHN